MYFLKSRNILTDLTHFNQGKAGSLKSLYSSQEIWSHQGVGGLHAHQGESGLMHGFGVRGLDPGVVFVWPCTKSHTCVVLCVVHVEGSTRVGCYH